ncbi:S8 family serine peptidase [Roseateles cellulosilyticus]|uniref:S8 family serine peptidase n=1 Tax=Pelomonas cellulosilytica TaxID=2906762 RepID=A0ABS8XT88_9BURK|nr:S8 family serine peptidase [Pelomonas sp. P8]MCE4555934.1 S8 family serine peptidase [Pelomonas sp. P8]
MSEDLSDGVQPVQTTGRYIVTYKDGAQGDGLAQLKKRAGLTKARTLSIADFGEGGVDFSQLPESGGLILEHIGIAVLNIDPEAAGAMVMEAGADSPILAVEPEGVMYALSEVSPLSLDYLRGFRDAADSIFVQANTQPEGHDLETEAAFADTAALTWGLQATKASASRFSGNGIRVAVLDTGLASGHPDFAGRPVVAKSFVPGANTADDGHGHGTHCIGTACGPLGPSTGRRYGVAHRAQVYVGKVLSDQGSGGDAAILAGIDWAIANGCSVISMSLGANVPTSTIAYETVGQRALNAGTLIVSAAGNGGDRASGQFGFVGRPANSRTFMAVAALDSALRVAGFSARDTARQPGTAVDVAAPGVAIYSSWPMPARYNTISGTSMATPHVAGIAALWAEATGARGAALWQTLVVNARTLSAPVVDVGRGLVQAP